MQVDLNKRSHLIVDHFSVLKCKSNLAFYFIYCFTFNVILIPNPLFLQYSLHKVSEVTLNCYKHVSILTCVYISIGSSCVSFLWFECNTLVSINGLIQYIRKYTKRVDQYYSFNCMQSIKLLLISFA